MKLNKKKEMRHQRQQFMCLFNASSSQHRSTAAPSALPLRTAYRGPLRRRANPSAVARPVGAVQSPCGKSHQLLIPPPRSDPSRSDFDSQPIGNVTARAAIEL